MMLDADVVAVSPSSVYRVLKEAGLMAANAHALKRHRLPAAAQRPRALARRLSYINIGGTFYYLCQRPGRLQPLHRPLGDPRDDDRAEIELIIQRAREKFPGADAPIISDNGPQFIAKDFKEFIRLCGMTHVLTSPYYPQSNGKFERFHKTLKSECIRPRRP